MLALIEKLEASEEFKKFKKENPEAYFCGVFFIMAAHEPENKRQLNFMLPSGKMVLFDMGLHGEKITYSELEQPALSGEKPKAIKDGEIKVDDEGAVNLIAKESGKRYDKTIAVLQKNKDGLLWNMTCIDGFTLHRYFVDAVTGKLDHQKDIKLQDMTRVENKTPGYIN